MDNNYWKEKYADMHLRLTNKIAELEKENAEFKKALKTLAEGLNIRQQILQEIKDNQSGGRMNNRFKFRAWWKPNYRKPIMLYDVEKTYDFMRGEPESICADCFGEVLEDEDYIVMQCTGLKDKNGKLIYEGDILDLYISTKKLYRYQVKYEIGSFMLVSNEEIFDFRNKWNDNAYPLSQLYFEYDNEDNCIWQCEVIGNIYQNKELLEEE